MDLTNIKTYSLKRRKSKVNFKDFAHTLRKSTNLSDFLSSLPNILVAKDLKDLINSILTARKKARPIVFMLGAHIIKCGLNPLIIELIKKGFISCIALNGAGIIHDFEIAYIGKTSEDVEESLKGGMFGLAWETADLLNEAILKDKVLGMGEAVGKMIKERSLPYKNYSLLYQAYKKKIVLTVHVALGTDVIHQHPRCDGASIGEATLKDFRKFTEVISRLEGGVLMNFGSAVILPEVFLKALNLVRNLGYKVENFTTANFDMYYHYRPFQNIVKRPPLKGKGYYIIGHHEIMFPLLANILLEKIR